MKDLYVMAEYAKKTFLALKNPYGTVNRVFPLAVDSCALLLAEKKTAYYIGIKDTAVIPKGFTDSLLSGGFITHTLDPASFGGRAVDVHLTNPLTGKPMTGSSSATAINVLSGLNDAGIGTDGGGSVLAPAASLNLFGFICPLIEADYLKQFSKKSTDNIEFSPSIGFITREFSCLETLVKTALPQVFSTKTDETAEKQTFRCTVSKKNDLCQKSQKMTEVLNQKNSSVTETTFPDLCRASRLEMIDFLRKNLGECDFLVSYEGPVDIWGMGDTVFGHFDERTKENQAAGGKGFVKVANMVNATAFCIPSQELACAFVLICESNPVKINKTLEFAKKIAGEQDELVKRYFLNFNNHFPRGFNE